MLNLPLCLVLELPGLEELHAPVQRSGVRAAFDCHVWVARRKPGQPVQFRSAVDKPKRKDFIFEPNANVRPQLFLPHRSSQTDGDFRDLLQGCSAAWGLPCTGSCPHSQAAVRSDQDLLPVPRPMMLVVALPARDENPADSPDISQHFLLMLTLSLN